MSTIFKNSWLNKAMVAACVGAIVWVTAIHNLVAGEPSKTQTQTQTQAKTQIQPQTAMTTRVDAKAIVVPQADDGFHFVIFGDRTGGVPAGLEILKQAVRDTNLLDPDFVMTVGDLIQGYNTEKDWLPEMRQYKAIMKRLNMNWFPVAGNHDIYWQGKGRPQGHHESNYEKHFGPLWYSFEHKNCGIIVLYSDEGDPKTNRKGFHDFQLQQMSQAQLAFIDEALEQLKAKDHVLVFLHHPRWIEKRYQGSNWPTVHKKLVAAGNVKACFAGHIHFLHYDGPQDGIEYFTLGATGGRIQSDIPDAGFLQHMNVVSVRKENISVAAVPVGAVFDPKKFTTDFHAAVELARSVAPVQTSPPLLIAGDGSVEGEVAVVIANPSPGAVRGTLVFDSQNVEGWGTTLEHSHFTVPAGDRLNLKFKLRRFTGADELTALPRLLFQPKYVANDHSAAVALAPVSTPIEMELDKLPVGFFDDASPRALDVQTDAAAASVNSADVDLPDGPLTIEAWVKPSDLSGYKAIVAKTQNSEYALFCDQGVPRFDIHLGGKYRTAKGLEKLDTAKWSHLAGVFDGKYIKLFVDGQEVAMLKASGKRRINRLPLIVGADPDSASQPTRCFSGLIDEVRLSKSAVYKKPFQPAKSFAATDNTVLLLHFDQRIGPFGFDHSDKNVALRMGPQTSLVPVQR